MCGFFPEHYPVEKMGKAFLGLRALLDPEYEFVLEDLHDYENTYFGDFDIMRLNSITEDELLACMASDFWGLKLFEIAGESSCGRRYG